MNNRVVIGVDISKDTLDACKLPGNRQIQVSNNHKGYQKLLRWIEKEPEALFVFEATGAYHRQLEMALGTSSTPCVKVNPKQARRFAQAVGTLAKTDQVDAAMLARMGVALDLTAQNPPPKILYLFKDLISARRGLIKDQTAAKARLVTAQVSLIKRQLERRLKQIQADIEQIDKEIIAHVTDDPVMARQVDILTSILGIGVLTAITILTDMPELGTLDNKQAASLAGLAPMSQSSGKWQGKERIQGGRAILRWAIYMPALVATRVNPDMREKYQQLLVAGKAKKAALTAIMRKLIILANSLLKGRPKMGTTLRLIKTDTPPEAHDSQGEGVHSHVPDLPAALKPDHWADTATPICRASISLSQNQMQLGRAATRWSALYEPPPA